jgi:hypothetical protein
MMLRNATVTRGFHARPAKIRLTVPHRSAINATAFLKKISNSKFNVDAERYGR